MRVGDLLVEVNGKSLASTSEDAGGTVLWGVARMCQVVGVYY